MCIRDSAKTLDHQALNQAAASLYRDRFDDTPGIVYAAGVDHAYNLAQEFRAAGQAGRDTGRLRAWRDQCFDQRSAAGRGLELAPRHDLHAPGSDGLTARLPAADRPHHAHPSAQGGRRGDRLRAQVGHALGEGHLAPLPVSYTHLTLPTNREV